ncbi:MAG: hypothetical protein GEV03_27435 [Streptosporangiales bacterium]|nr:hypothetical protein [Streptosporangiales bacterium]
MSAARLAGIALGAMAGRAAYVGLTRRRSPSSGPDGASAWSRTNHRGEQVTLLEGPAYVLAAAAGAAVTPGLPRRLRIAAALAALGTGAVGAYDDFTDDNHIRGFKGHLGALRRGKVTSGTVKIVGVGATGLAAGALVNRNPVDAVAAGGVIAGGANLVNLLDLRPGRAIKAGLLAGTPALLAGGPSGAVVAAPLGAAASLLPEDLNERAMLGDAGAHALGALLGLAAVTRLGRRGQLAVLGGLVGLTAASEVVSFTKVIERVGPLRWLDHLGRRTPPR